MLIFLRQFGCTFCRESLTDILAVRKDLQREDTVPVLVHQMSDDFAAKVLGIYELGDLHRISDPDLLLYDYFGLKKATTGQLISPAVWWRGIAGLFKGHIIGREAGNARQMPGVFVLYKSRIVNKFIHQKPCDRPDYLQLAQTARTGLKQPKHQNV